MKPLLCTVLLAVVYGPLIHSVGIKCPECDTQAGCRPPCSECIAPDGSIIRAPIKPLQINPPKGCQQDCDSWYVDCAPPRKCTPELLEKYGYCPKCVPQAGCQQLGCNCYDCHNIIHTPPFNPPQPCRPYGCPECPQNCIIPFVPCGNPKPCTDTQLDTYTKCPKCVPFAGCKKVGCDCQDCDGYVYTPGTYPAQPPRPKGCPECPKICPITTQGCPTELPECTDDQYDDYVLKCEECDPEAGCRPPCSDCIAPNGKVIQAPIKPLQKNPPKGCKQNCKSWVVRCLPPVKCTAEQLEKYNYCPKCVPQAGCQQLGCDCYDCDNNIYSPPFNPPQPCRPAGCPECPKNCIIPIVPCGKPKPCTRQQLQTYDKKCPVCPACVPLAGCKQIGCDCRDCDGNVLTPPTNPPQPPRPKGCPECPTNCPVSKIRCPTELEECTDDQYDDYVLKCEECDPEAGCRPPCSDCIAPNGKVIQAPIKPLQKNPPKGCKQNCKSWVVRCAPPVKCTAEQLEKYNYCPKCVPQAGCQQLGCNCYDCDKTIYTPPFNPPQPCRPKGCPECPQNCIIPFVPCGDPKPCTDTQLCAYTKCPKCVANAGCKRFGCDCRDCDGNVWTPGTNPAQPPRPKGCPDCPKNCPLAKIYCPPELQECTDDQLDDYVLKCEECDPEAGCRPPCSECIAPNGKVIQAPIKPLQKNPPKGCKQNCKSWEVACIQVIVNCTAEQLEKYNYCPKCVPQAGCQQLGCDCYDCDNNIYSPPFNPPQPCRPAGCPECPKNCIIPIVPCGKPKPCTRQQLQTYDKKCPVCPACVPLAGCKQIGCDCRDCDGNVLTPPTNPPQPPRPKGCPECPTNCPVSKIRCPTELEECTDDQYDDYVLKCEECDPEAGCRPPCSDCIAPNGKVIQAPIKPLQKNPPKGCKQNCKSWVVRCAPPVKCTAEQLEKYNYCPKCVPQAGCQQLGCNCYDCYKTIYTPPFNPPQPCRPKGCPECPQNCIIPFVPCGDPKPCTDTQLCTYTKCPKCVANAGCKRFGCDCKDCDGNVWTPGTNPPQPPRPKGCPDCSQVCPQLRIYCPPELPRCTDDQLDTYILKCDECDPEAGCRPPCSACIAPDGCIIEAPRKPLQKNPPKGCKQDCKDKYVLCAQPTKCTAEQLEKYNYCPKCVPQAGCKQLGCDCKDCNGYLWTPATNPPQPARPIGCPACPKNCPVVRCPAPTTCTKDQLKRYVPLCPDCVPQAGCKQIGCDCLDCKGNLLTPPTNPPQPWRPPICPKCPTSCIVAYIKCAAPTACTPTQLQFYVPKCPKPECKRCPTQVAAPPVCCDDDGDDWGDDDYK